VSPPLVVIGLGRNAISPLAALERDAGTTVVP